MGYSLFAQRKYQLTGDINSVNLKHTQRSGEQELLATQTSYLKSEVSQLEGEKAAELAELYELLAHSTTDGLNEDALLLTNDSNPENDRDINDFSKLAQQLINNDANRESIMAAIEKKEAEYAIELEKINRETYVVERKEKPIEMDIKRLDTKLTAMQQELEQIIEAESKAIEKSTPSFKSSG